jgi:toxin CcdB
MAQFDVHTNPSGAGLLLDCQADLLSHLNTRLVVPLLPPDQAPKPAGRLNPSFDLRGEQFLMVTQYASALETRELGPKIASLAHRDHKIVNALDVLITGV